MITVMDKIMVLGAPILIKVTKLDAHIVKAMLLDALIVKKEMQGMEDLEVVVANMDRITKKMKPLLNKSPQNIIR